MTDKNEKKWSLGDILVNTRLVRDNELLPAVKTVCLLVVFFYFSNLFTPDRFLHNDYEHIYICWWYIKMFDSIKKKNNSYKKLMKKFMIWLEIIKKTETEMGSKMETRFAANVVYNMIFFSATIILDLHKSKVVE